MPDDFPAMKKLILLRHGKSSWDDPTLGDHDRPLNRRGKAAAPAIAAWLAERSHLPDTVLCSSSRRTRQTVKRMRARIPDLPEPVVEGDLYLASSGTMRDRLARLPANCGTVMLVGHQPGLGSLVRQLSDERGQQRYRRALTHFPTAAAAVLEIDIDDWSALDRAAARFIGFATPRELMDV